MSKNASPEKPPSQPAKRKRPFIRWQKPMIGVLIALTPCTFSAIYRFGWRTLAVIAAVTAAAVVSEWLFTRQRNEPVSSAVFVTSLILALILPPTLPLWMAAVGAVVAIAISKEAFGGFGRNVFNPAMTGRCFLYICFAQRMSVFWSQPASGVGGMTQWLTEPIQAVTGATPLDQFKTALTTAGQSVETVDLPGYWDLLIGNRAGCLGETAGLAILLGAAYLLWKRYADWRLIASAIVGLLVTTVLLRLSGVQGIPDPLWNLLAGGFLFAAVFMVTDPVSAPRRRPSKYISGFLVGALTVILRRFGIFPEGVMFALLLANTFNPTIDLAVAAVQEKKKAKAEADA